MREIIFRGKSRRYLNWVEGSLINIGKYCCILEPDCESYGATYLDADLGDIDGQAVPVIPESVGQYTGMVDKNGKKIFEGDIVELKTHGGTIDRYLIWWNKEMCMMTAVSLDGIEFNGHDYWDGGPNAIEYSTFCLMMQDPYGDFEYIKVIGNVHDNTELIQCK